MIRETAERIIKVGFRRKPKSVFDEAEQTAAQMARQGWKLTDTVLEEGLGNIHLFFERTVEGSSGSARSDSDACKP